MVRDVSLTKKAYTAIETEVRYRMGRYFDEASGGDGEDPAREGVEMEFAGGQLVARRVLPGYQPPADERQSDFHRTLHPHLDPAWYFRILLDAHDCPFGNASHPVVTHFRPRGSRNSILWPLSGHTTPHSDNFGRFIDYSDRPWRDKIDRAVWRGTSTGFGVDVNSLEDVDTLTAAPIEWLDHTRNVTYRQASRFQLVDALKDDPDFDVGFSKLVQVADIGARQLLTSRGFLKGNLGYRDLLACRYLIVVDGNAYPSQLPWSLSSGSLVLMPLSAWESIVAHPVPWEHYVPLETDFSDAREKLAWCRANEARCQDIVRRAREFMRPYYDLGRERAIRRVLVERYVDNFGETRAVVPAPLKTTASSESLSEADIDRRLQDLILAGATGEHELSVCIVGYHSRPWDLRCIETLRRFSRGNVEVMYVDNTRENLGLSLRWNRLARESTSPIICFMNPDVLVTPDWDVRCLEQFARDSKVGMLGPMLANEVGHSSWPGPPPDAPPDDAGLEQLSGAVRNADPAHGYQHMVLGSCMMIRREVFEQVGGFPESVPLYFNDHCISEAVRQAGWKLGLVRDAVVWHMRQGTTHFTGDDSHCSQGMKIGARAYIHWRRRNHITVPTTVSPEFLAGFGETAETLADPPARRARRPVSLCAAYKVFNAEIYLPYSIASIYDHVDSIVVFLSTRPWNGPEVPLDQTAERIRGIPDPGHKITLVVDDWRLTEQPASSEENEYAEMVQLLEFVRQNAPGATHYFYVDWDEIYRPEHLDYLKQFLAGMDEDAFVRGTWRTYWRSLHWQVDPPDPSRALVAFPLRPDAHFKALREVTCPVEHRLPPDKFLIHHFSYALPTWRLEQKIRHFSHCDDIRPQWVESVWERWASQRDLRGLHPVDPGMFQRAVPADRDALPAVMKEHPYYGMDIIE